MTEGDIYVTDVRYIEIIVIIVVLKTKNKMCKFIMVITLLKL